MKKVYVVTEGEYSDYHICGVFDTKELAKKFINSFKSGYSRRNIEEFTLNPLEMELNKDMIPFFLRMDKKGICTEIYASDSTYGFIDDEIGFDVEHNMYCHVFAKDEKHAIKIANEKRVQLIANDRWDKQGI